MEKEDLKKLTILLVEDDEIIMQIIYSMVKEIFAKIYMAKDGEEGLKTFRDKKPDVVISDIYMPNMDGFAMIKKIKEYSPNTPIIIASVSYDHEILLKAIDLGVDNYIVKPIAKDKLITILIKTLEVLFKNRAIEKKNRQIKVLLDSQPDIALLTDGENLINANKSFLNFFNEFKSLQEFKNKHKCIVEFFEKVDKYGNVYKNIENKNWIEYILKNEKDLYSCVIKRDKKEFTFKITLNPIESKFDTEYIVNLTDITKIDNYKGDLQEKIEMEIEKNRRREQILFQQSKLASMGEMIGNIAHQWRQPLNALGLILQKFKIIHKRGKLNQEYLDENMAKGMELIHKMSTTIDDFRNFFKPETKKEYFYLSEIVRESFNLLEASLKHYNINVEINLNDKIKVFGFANQLSQVILNIINNSKDVFLERKIENRNLRVKTYIKNEKVYLTIEDNGGGIKDKLLDKIFEPYFTTKDEGKGTGIGLYMSKIIIETNMGGSIYAKNIEDGVKFMIEFGKENKL